MYFGLSEDQVMLQDTVRRFLDTESELDHVRGFANGDTTLAGKLHAGLMELGVPLVLIPEAQGGLGMGVLEAALIQEMLGRYVTPSAFTPAYGMAVAGLNTGANADQRNNWLGRIAGGEVILGVGVTEAVGAREDAGLTVTGDKVSGRASFVMGAETATHFLLGAGNALAIIDRSSDGVQETALTTIDKTRRVIMLDLDNVACDVLDGAAQPAIDAMINVGRVLLAADSFGAAEVMLQKAVDYSKDREQFNRPIGSFQAVKHMCADMAARLEPCRSLLWYAAYAQDNVPEEGPLMSCMVKSHISEVGKFIARTSTEVHGGMGFTDLMGLHYWFKRIGFNRQLLGGPEKTRHDAAVLQGFAK
ncbi:MAG: acyl-CoA dehydrogenase [Rhizobiales bacterium TMED143]|nr:acyl-CoA dehydrogenase [Rhodobiaceae bacterium]OUV92430.1 MAG: acyl-CoA dehydrogenase [Rhizobiales bacterium TMED143]CAI8360368.1 MAG: (R)-benzylsuccinyl-CoA dehydrogenase [Rhodobiaceae bacterium UBA7378]